MTNQTRKLKGSSVPWSGWNKKAPFGKERTRMYHKCGAKCFLHKKSLGFPICSKGTCKISNKGLWAAYVRAKQWGNKKNKYKGRSKPKHSRKSYKMVANKARRMLTRRGFKVGR